MNIVDTPNPNAKKIIIDHSYEMSTYLTEEMLIDEILIKLFSHADIVNLFTGPGFITILKVNEANWDLIFNDLDLNT